ncbi:MAG TPA: DinB family protein [Candidatus Dormibacteraeota bacterium]|nr:DinB family protein [Candidatus Dormibacteraeota bacterium]
MPAPAWLGALEPLAPDVVACWLVADNLRSLRRELRRRAGPGTATGLLVQQEAVADALEAALRAMPAELLRAPGGEEDWNVAQTFAHATGSRRWLVHAAALTARGEWPADAPQVRPGVPGPAEADLETLLTLLEKSRRSMATSAAAIAGHEADRSLLDHPLVGKLRCGEWLLFAGVHDLMHLEQLHGLLERGVEQPARA